jgi:DNA-directed RNA polymerase subunit RPC12/RpoP
MPVYVSYSVSTEARVTATYTCAACGHAADMRIRGTGVASYGLLQGRSEAGEEAKKGALENARNVGELARCPRCGHRDFSTWRRRWIRAALWPLLAFPGVWLFGVLAGLKSTNLADDTLAIVKMGGFFALVPEAWIALYFLAELKQASEIQFISTRRRKHPEEEERPPARRRTSTRKQTPGSG